MRLQFLVAFASITTALSAPAKKPALMRRSSTITAVPGLEAPLQAWKLALTSFSASEATSAQVQDIINTGAQAATAIYDLQVAVTTESVHADEISAISSSFDTFIPILADAISIVTEKKDTLLATDPSGNIKQTLASHVYTFYLLTENIFGTLSSQLSVPYNQHFDDLHGQIKPELDAAFVAYLTSGPEFFGSLSTVIRTPQ